MKSKLFEEDIPLKGEQSLDNIFDIIFKEVVPHSLNTGSGGYMAYIPGGGIFLAALADFICKSCNRYVGVNFAAPLLAKMERQVILWIADLMDFPASARGILTSGGSLSNLTAFIVARDMVLKDDLSKGRIYASAQTHHSVWKAAHAVGLRSEQVVKISLNENQQIDLKELDEKIANDINWGLKPFLVIGNAGTTDCGAIDNLIKISEISKKYGMWFHIDGAYGGFFYLTEKGKRRLKGLPLADSLTLDPHKGMFLPYGTGLLLIREGEKLKEVFKHSAPYISETLEDDNQVWDFSEMSLELSRDARGLRLYLPMKYYGVDTFIHQLNEKLSLTDYIYQELKKEDCWQILLVPDLSLVTFRYVGDKLDKGELNLFNKKLLEEVNDRKRVHISGTTINNKYYLRCCILSYLTHKKQVDFFLDDLRESLNMIDT